ncbi:histidine phosphatase family protein [Acinetobacter rudis]|uniref:histidine phosphatase family protein n=1 Tax=Acinetobacter rudis TaxID=632955 RepID=UPI00280DC71C|nr:histidine phosphatase family protein [Acinetobacter rudis]MDQ8953322.1 histidine phosphatase family protein [Acinetobacter rudis]
MLRIDVLRHGESELSACLRGSLNDALTPQGWQQMQQEVANVVDVYSNQFNSTLVPWQAIWTSPLQRCERFASDLSERLNLDLYKSAKFQEMHFGDWEGQTTALLYQQYPEQLAEFWQHPTQFTPPSAESLEVFQQRVWSGLEQMLVQMQTLQLTHVLLVSHGGVIKLLKCLALQQDLDLILTQSAELGQLYRFELTFSRSQQLCIRSVEANVRATPE